MTGASFYWHDYETSGTDSRRDRPVQFAGQRTTLELEPIGEPLSIFCQPARDSLPQPAACMVTGITPQRAEHEGVTEVEFAARIHEELAAAGTCGVGYNSLRFDDEFTRQLLYRNFYEPYAREWEHGNSRWDLIDLARMCYALRPQGIEWPRHPDGQPSFRLGDLASTNHLVHTQAHDALSDVQTTIALARLLRVRQPRLFDYYFSLRRKQQAFTLLDHVHRTPVLHVSSRYPAERGCLAMVVPLALHPTQSNGVIVYDLDADPAALLELDVEDISDRVFTPRGDLPEDIQRIPLKTVHANKSPALAPLSVLTGADTARIGLNVERCLVHLEILRQAAGLTEKVRQVFSVKHDDGEKIDPELALYKALPSDADKRLRHDVRVTQAAELGTRNFPFRDLRYPELLFRYRARNFPASLSPPEATRWDEYRRAKLTTQTETTTLTLDAYFQEIAELRATSDVTKTAFFDALEQWGRQIL